VILLEPCRVSAVCLRTQLIHIQIADFADVYLIESYLLYRMRGKRRR
jgi:hypothetical protein